MSYVIAIFHQKGGVAKTTTALSLGGCFVEREHETLLIDLDPQGNLTGGLGIDPTTVRHSAADTLLGNEPLLRFTRETNLPGLDIVPSNDDMVMVTRTLHLREQYEYVLQEQLAQADLAHYDFVLIDCPPALGSTAVAALTAANLVIVPTQCEYFSMQTLDDTAALVNLVRQRTNPRLLFRLLVTMFDMRGQLHTRALQQLKHHFQPVLLSTVIGVDSKLRESQMAGQTITQYASKSRGATHYRQLAEELLPYAQKQVFQTA